MKETSNKLQWIWPSVVDIASAEKAAKQGAWAAVICAVITSVAAFIGHLNSNFYGFDAWAFLDAGLFAIVAFGIFKLSRVAAVFGLFLYSLERAVMWAEHGPKNPVLALIFILFFISSVRGTMEYHKFKKQKMFNS